MRGRLSIVMLIMGLIAAACTSGAGEKNIAADAETADGPRTDAAVRTGASVAPDFTIPIARNDGGRLVMTDYSLAENRGRPAVLYFSFAG